MGFAGWGPASAGYAGLGHAGGGYAGAGYAASGGERRRSGLPFFCELGKDLRRGLFFIF
jgi:hypothetical protein